MRVRLFLITMLLIPNLAYAGQIIHDWQMNQASSVRLGLPVSELNEVFSTGPHPGMDMGGPAEVSVVPNISFTEVDAKPSIYIRNQTVKLVYEVRAPFSKIERMPSTAVRNNNSYASDYVGKHHIVATRASGLVKLELSWHVGSQLTPAMREAIGRMTELEVLRLSQLDDREKRAELNQVMRSSIESAGGFNVDGSPQCLLQTSYHHELPVDQFYAPCSGWDSESEPVSGAFHALIAWTQDTVMPFYSQEKTLELRSHSFAGETSLVIENLELSDTPF